MKKSSIFITITFIFLLALTSISLAFLWLMDYDQQNYTRELNSKYSNAARVNLFYMSGIIGQSEFLEQSQNINMPEITNKQNVENILKNASIVQEITSDIGSSAILVLNKKHFLKIKHLDEVKVLEDKDFQSYRYLVIKIIFGLVGFILFAAYVFVILKLKPLRKLRVQIEQFALGNLSQVQNISSGNDEISDVSRAFYESVCQIKMLNDSRNLFLRNIMHELKTPITKGRLTAEMIQKDKYQERLLSVFAKLENLINELAAIEQVTSNIALRNKKVCFINDILDEAFDIAMIEKNQIKISKFENFSLNVDFKLFSIAIKNMIDNGIKYSEDKKISIKVSPKNIDFISMGKELNEDLKLYLQPFIKGENNQKSFGLGLYIVNNILKAHQLKLEYKYKNGFNIFSFSNLQDIMAKKL